MGRYVYSGVCAALLATELSVQLIKNAMTWPFVQDGIPILYYGTPHVHASSVSNLTITLVKARSRATRGAVTPLTAKREQLHDPYALVLTFRRIACGFQDTSRTNRSSRTLRSSTAPAASPSQPTAASSTPPCVHRYLLSPIIQTFLTPRVPPAGAAVRRVRVDAGGVEAAAPRAPHERRQRVELEHHVERPRCGVRVQ